jgi:hypothetical protein
VGNGLRDDEIRLVLPADPGYSRVARVAASGLGVRLGLRLSEVEDLRIAVDETLILLLRPEGASGTIVFTFSIGEHVLRIDAVSTAGDGQYWVDDAALSRFEQLVGPVVDHHEVDESGRTVRLVKNLPA